MLAVSVDLHGFEDFEDAVELEGHGAISALAHRLLRDDACVDVRLQVRDLLLHANCVLHNLLLALLRLDAHLEDFIDDLFEIFNHIVVLYLKVFIRRVYDAHEDLPIIL